MRVIYKIKHNRVSRSYTGGRKIDKFTGENAAADNQYLPEDWTASVTTAYSSGEKDGEGLGYTEDGVSIKDITGGDKLSILVKLLDSDERLIIQVHPTAEFAEKYLGEPNGKTECWYFLNCGSGACVYIGFKEGISRGDWEEAFDKQDSERMLSMLHKISVKPGDFIFVGGGMPHAIGAGCFMIELQEPSDSMAAAEKITPSGRVIPEKRISMGLDRKSMFDMYDYTGYTREELEKKVMPAPKKINDDIYEIAGAGLTDKFSMYRLVGGAELQPAGKYAVIIITGGDGMLCGKKAKKGDRFFACGENTIKLAGGSDFTAIVCE